MDVINYFTEYSKTGSMDGVVSRTSMKDIDRLIKKLGFIFKHTDRLGNETLTNRRLYTILLDKLQQEKQRRTSNDSDKH